MTRIARSRVQTSVPGFLLDAANTHTAIDYLDRCGRTLRADAEAYGFDPGGSYTVAVQTWDTARSPMRSLAFGRRVIGQEAVGLIPDPYFIHHDGYAEMRRFARHKPRWAERKSTLAWRGSVTGQGPFAATEDIPRIRLALRCRDLPDTDFGLIGVHETMHDARPEGEIAAFVAGHGLAGERWHMAAFGDYKFSLDIDGYAAAWGFLEKLILGTCVLKIASPYEQWFSHGLQPWVHYVPVREDLDDLPATLDWCRSNEAQCAWIANNGQRHGLAMTVDASLRQSCRALMQAAHLGPG